MGGPASSELLNLQMPDHRRAVPSSEIRPESKKGHDMISKEQLARMTRGSKLKITKFTPLFVKISFFSLLSNPYSNLEKDSEGDDTYNDIDAPENFEDEYHYNQFYDANANQGRQQQIYSPPVDDYNINLEDAVEVEKQISKLLESLRQQLDLSMDCEDWWIVTDPSTYTINKLSMFFKNVHIVREIIKAQKLETITISLIQFLSFDYPMQENLYVPLKNLIFFIHQSLLCQVRFLLERLPESSKKNNTWAKQLTQICESKQIRMYKDKSEVLQALTVNNDNAKSVIQNICKIKPKLTIYGGVTALLEEVNNISIARIRELMFNSIQYRDGKIIAEAIDEMRGFSNTTKTGFNKTGNSQVFNPHMPGPGINSPSHAFFDDDLPVVTAPFLPE